MAVEPVPEIVRVVISSWLLSSVQPAVETV